MTKSLSLQYHLVRVKYLMADSYLRALIELAAAVNIPAMMGTNVITPPLNSPLLVRQRQLGILNLVYCVRRLKVN